MDAPHTPDALRRQLQHMLEWRDAHADFDAAVRDVPRDDRGMRPAGLPYSLWELLEHVRRAQRDILDFCRDPNYAEQTWPDDYWPDSPQPPSDKAWNASIKAFRDDRDDLQQLAADPDLDLLATIPHGSGQTYLRELLLTADHTAYHIGQMIVLRRLLGNWE